MRVTAPPRVRTYRYTTVSATCPTCGRVRMLKILKSPKRLEQALVASRRRQAEVDEMAVARLVAGDPPETTTRAELLGITDRTVQRLRSAS